MIIRITPNFFVSLSTSPEISKYAYQNTFIIISHRQITTGDYITFSYGTGNDCDFVGKLNCNMSACA